MASQDPINFHMVIAGFTFLAALIHCVAHGVHIAVIGSSPRMQEDPLKLWQLTADEKTSGMSFWLQVGLA